MTRHNDPRCSMYRIFTYIGVIDGVNGGKKLSLLKHGLFGAKGRVSKYRRLAIGNAFQLIIRFCICQLGTDMIAFPLGCATCIIDSVTRDILPIASRYQYLNQVSTCSSLVPIHFFMPIEACNPPTIVISRSNVINNRT